MRTIIRMLAVLTIIGVISGGLLSQISIWSKPKIAAHRELETKNAIFQVLPEGKSFTKMETANLEVYSVFDDSGKLIGHAVPFEGNGFQGKIRMMAGLTSDLDKVTGLQVLEQVETPGLGTKIVEDPSQKEDPYWFPNQFKEVETQPMIGVVKNQKPVNKYDIQAITGATISSKAVVQIMNQGIQVLRKMDAEGKLNNAGGEK